MYEQLHGCGGEQRREWALCMGIATMYRRYFLRGFPCLKS
jgi:hypothetical protein